MMSTWPREEPNLSNVLGFGRISGCLLQPRCIWTWTIQRVRGTYEYQNPIISGYVPLRAEPSARRARYRCQPWNTRGWVGSVAPFGKCMRDPLGPRFASPHPI